MQQAFLVFVNTILLAGNLVATCIFLALTFRQLRGDHGDKDYLLCILLINCLMSCSAIYGLQKNKLLFINISILWLGPVFFVWTAMLIVTVGPVLTLPLIIIYAMYVAETLKAACPCFDNANKSIQVSIGSGYNENANIEAGPSSHDNRSRDISYAPSTPGNNTYTSSATVTNEVQTQKNQRSSSERTISSQPHDTNLGTNNDVKDVSLNDGIYDPD